MKISKKNITPDDREYADRAAWLEKVHKQYYQQLYRFANAFLKSGELSRDVLQDVFLQLWGMAGRIEPEKPVAPLLFTMTKNQVMSVFRKAARDQALVAKIIDGYPSGSEEAEARYIQKEFTALAEKAVSLLPPARREVYRLCRQEELTYQEAGKRLGISPATVNSQMVKALRFIRHYLSSHGL